jgi:cysteine-rich repeat protein
MHPSIDQQSRDHVPSKGSPVPSRRPKASLVWLGAGPALASGLVAVILLLIGAPAQAVDYNGTVQFQGQVTFPVAIPGIAATGLVVEVDSETNATGNGVKCSISATQSDNPDGTGAYPSVGEVSATMLVERGGPQFPDGDCIVTVRATGTDGSSVSARGSQTVFVPVDTVDASGTVIVPDIVVRESKAIAGVDKDCLKWVKKQLKQRAKCNDKILKKGGAYALEKCKDAGPEPPDCDPGQHVEAILALAYGDNDQQVDPGSGEAVDYKALKDQVKCQKLIGKAATGFSAKLTKLIEKKCVEAGIDSTSCRDARSNDAKKKLDKISKCVGDSVADDMTARFVPVVGPPCDVCIDGSGVIDRKCLRECFQAEIDELADGIIGDVAVCGNGILQPGEQCDDGNTTPGDCCSDSCAFENLGDQTCGVGACEVTVATCDLGMPVVCTPGSPGTEGPLGDPTCSDGIDNDCDGATDGADANCQ